jgi:hypothetical protein
MQAEQSVFLQMLTSVVWVCVMEIIHIFRNPGLASLSKLEAQHNHSIDLHAFSGLSRANNIKLVSRVQ